MPVMGGEPQHCNSKRHPTSPGWLMGREGREQLLQECK